MRAGFPVHLAVQRSPNNITCSVSEHITPDGASCVTAWQGGDSQWLQLRDVVAQEAAQLGYTTQPRDQSRSRRIRMLNDAMTLANQPGMFRLDPELAIAFAMGLCM